MSNDNMIVRALKKGDLFDKIFCLGVMKCGYSNDKLQTLEVRNKKYRYVKKKYSSCLKKYANSPFDCGEGVAGRQKVIWILWLQGIDNAPDIVKKCYESVQKYKGDYEVRVVDNDNLRQLCKLPDYIYEKWEKGQITNAHMSDIIRTDLIIRHGGIWLDATVYLTGQLPEYVMNSDFFIYKHGVTRDKTILANSWLISGNRDNRLLMCVRQMLFEYWKSETKVKEYFLWHLCMTIAIENYWQDWERVFLVPDILPETMRWNLAKSYSKEYFDYLRSLTSVHKLSYRLTELSEKDTKGSIYEHIINLPL